MLAAINLTGEYWQLVRLVIALFQPVLVLALIGGLVVATAHLLTMIGTRWGDRRASSKAMFFSVIIHLLLAMGLVTLIPEYRSNLFSHLADLEPEPIRIANSPDQSSDVQDDLGKGGTSPLFHRPAATQQDWTRTDVPQQMAAEIEPLQKPADTPVFQPQPFPDRKQLPEPAAPMPTPEMPVAPADLQQAKDDVKPEAIPTQSRPEPAVPAVAMDRTEPSAAPASAPDVPQRPEQMSPEESSATYSPDRTAPDLMQSPVPNAELATATDSKSPRTAQPAPSELNSELATPNPKTAPLPGPGENSGAGMIARTESRTTLPDIGASTTERVRPRTSVPMPSAASPRSPTGGSSAAVSPLPMTREMPQLSRGADPFTRPGNQERVPSAYRLRTEEEREKAILQFGGSAESEAAVDRSLKWMASVQNPAGYWDASEYGAGQVEKDENGIDRKNAGREADVGVTALAVLAFLGKLNTVDQGQYSPQVNKALRWIVSQQKTKHWGEGWGSTPGYLGGNATDFEAMYCHAMATFAIGEAYAMSRDNPDAQWLKQPLELAVNFILDVQNVDGGWRYIKGQREGDMSIFGWQLMALKSAEAAGFFVDDARKERMRKFLVDRQLGNAGGLAGYRPKEAASASMTAEALYCRQMLGVASDSRANREAIQLMLANMPRRATLNFYYWYYGTLAMHQHGGPEWDQWNSTVRDLLISEQRLNGPLAGSWDPRDIWGGYGGRMYSTAIATLSLEVYYRYLPLYRMHEQ